MESAEGGIHWLSSSGATTISVMSSRPNVLLSKPRISIWVLMQLKISIYYYSFLEQLLLTTDISHKLNLHRDKGIIRSGMNLDVAGMYNRIEECGH